MNIYKTRPLSANMIKYIAALAMLIDHTAWLFLPINTALGQAVHIVGRLAMPTMCYFIAEGFYRTHSVPKYAARLLIFAVISQPCYTLAGLGGLDVLFTLLLGLLALWVCESRARPALSALAVLAALYLSTFCDWPVFGVLFVLIFGIRRGDTRLTLRVRFLAFEAAALGSAVQLAAELGEQWTLAAFQLGTLLAPLLLVLYNGKRGRGGAFSKWFFYVFYPLHLLALGVIARLLAF